MRSRSRLAFRSRNREAWAGSEAVYAAVYRDLLRVAFVLTGSAAAAEGCRARRVRQGRPAHRHLGRACRVLAGLRSSTVADRCIAGPSPRPAPDRASDAVMDVGLVELRDALVALPIRQRSAIVLRYCATFPRKRSLRI